MGDVASSATSYAPAFPGIPRAPAPFSSDLDVTIPPLLRCMPKPLISRRSRVALLFSTQPQPSFDNRLLRQRTRFEVCLACLSGCSVYNALLLLGFLGWLLLASHPLAFLIHFSGTRRTPCLVPLQFACWWMTDASQNTLQLLLRRCVPCFTGGAWVQASVSADGAFVVLLAICYRLFRYVWGLKL
jgi:hypothetical protein